MAVSTGEIVVNVGNNSLHLIDPDSFDLGIKLIDFSTEDDFENSIEYFEYEPGVLMCFVGHKDSITCHVFKTNITTNTYADSEYRSNSFEHQIERLSGINCISGKIFAIQKVDKSIIIALTYKSASDNEISSVIKFSDFIIDNRDITFNSIEVLKKFNIVNKEFVSFSDVIAKVISTSLFDFAITNENKLLIIDDKYIIDALTFTKETKEVQVTDSHGTTSIEVQDLGYSDKNSVLFMRPDVNESQYYNSNEIFLQNVFDVFENQDRVYICDKYGIYELQPNKNLKNRFYSQNGKIYNVVANIVNQNVSYGLLYCKSSDDTSISIFKHNYEVKEVSDEKLRYNYIDLHNSDWQVFDPENLVYDSNKKIIEMNGIIYVSIVDRMSSLFNTTKNINYSTSLNVFEDIDPKRERVFLKKLLTETYKNTSFSCVCDSYDYWNVVKNIIPSLKKEILEHNGCFLVRGDSGDCVDVVTQTVYELWNTFGGTVNSKGYKVLDPHVKAIYGDSIQLETAEKIYSILMKNGFAASNVSLGVGSFSMHCIIENGQFKPFTRDTFSSCIKACDAVIN